MNDLQISTDSISYEATKRFSKLVIQYLKQDASLKPFISDFPSKDALAEAIQQKKQQERPRQALIETIRAQYAAFNASNAIEPLLERLRQPNCFTITTAHQPNLLGGPLYFLYKIIHAIKLTTYCREQFPEYDFLPVFWLGSEDADLDELGHLYIETEQKTWKTNQTGAVGRMQIDSSCIELRDTICAELEVKPHGSWLKNLLQDCYTQHRTVAQATQAFVHHLLGSHDLLVLDPDHPTTKQLFVPVMERELNDHFSATEVTKTAQRFPPELTAQDLGRSINLFYLQAQRRDRIEQVDHYFLRFPTDAPQSIASIREELHAHPERFSPNVVLRPVYQESILPNIAFIGGGGELAYWMQLKDVFDAAAVTFPILVLRHSLLLIDEKARGWMEHFGLKGEALFQDRAAFQKNWVIKHTPGNLQLEAIRIELRELYGKAAMQAAAQDPTLQEHTQRLATQAEKKLIALEKKMYRAAKRKLDADIRKMDRLSQKLFPLNNLQERVHSNLMYLAAYGPSWLTAIQSAMPDGLESSFTISTIK